MKKIGLVGGTGPESTLIYYKELNRRINERSDGTDFPEISIESLNLNRALGYVEKEQYGELAAYVSRAIRNLEKSGAQVIALTAATMHIVYDMVAQNVDTPFISIPEAAAEYAALKGYHRVGLLGTIFTMEKAYLSKAFIGRLTAPIMWFFVCEGYYYTRDAKKYLQRLGIFAISTFNTDYILTKKENYDKAIDVLNRAGYQIEEL